MRKKLSDYLNQLQDKNIYLLHADMFPYKTFNSYNLGIQEQNLVNIACGLAYAGKKVIVYGVCGFILYKAFEQIKFNTQWCKDKSCIIFCNAGHTGCYDFINIGHTIKDDLEIAKLLNLKVYTPTHQNFTQIIESLLNKKGSYLVRLGNDLN